MPDDLKLEEALEGRPNPLPSSRGADVMGELTKAQIRFLALHNEDPKPHRWAWQINGRDALGAPDTWTHLRAWSKTKTAAVTAAELEGLAPYWTQFPEVSDAGRAALAPQQGEK